VAKKKWTPEWEEMQRKTLGLFVSDGGRYQYFHAVYEVTERSLKDQTVWRTRVENGDPIDPYDHPNIYDIFKMTSLGYHRLMYEAKKKA
jgi:hypothetical protein